MDQNIQAEDIDLYLQHNVYIPENNYFNCDPFPIEWLEIVDKQQELKNIGIDDKADLTNEDKIYMIINTTSIDKMKRI